MFLIYELRAAGLIELAQVKDNLRLTGMRITLNGWKALEGYRVPNSQSSKAFLAMCFAEELRPISENGLEAGIKDAGYDAIRVDKREHTDKIDDLIIAEIKESRFVVADFTKQRGGVYFEAGFAKGLGLPVIWTCRQDDIENLHFDTRQYNTIVWSEAKDLRRRLAVRIRAVVGTGPKQDAKSIHLTTT